jgi:hypothetical protein
VRHQRYYLPNFNFSVATTFETHLRSLSRAFLPINPSTTQPLNHSRSILLRSRPPVRLPFAARHSYHLSELCLPPSLAAMSFFPGQEFPGSQQHNGYPPQGYSQPYPPQGYGPPGPQYGGGYGAPPPQHAPYGYNVRCTVREEYHL